MKKAVFLCSAFFVLLLGGFNPLRAQSSSQAQVQHQQTPKKTALNHEAESPQSFIAQPVKDVPVHFSPGQAPKRLDRDMKVPAFTEYKQMPKVEPRDPNRTPINQ